MTYKLFNDPLESTPTLDGIIRTNSDGTKTTIPLDTNNADYAEYLEWIDAGNTPEAAD
jgi:hypothetical protein